MRERAIRTITKINDLNMNMLVLSRLLMQSAWVLQEQVHWNLFSSQTIESLWSFWNLFPPLKLAYYIYRY